MTQDHIAYDRHMTRWVGCSLVFACLAACTKPNPAATCKSGACSDPAFPYCDSDGAISGDPGACIAVTCTPGSVGACEGSNAALICNATGNGYDQMPCAIGCDSTNLTCTTMCTQHSQCASGICKSDGTCAMDSEIAFTTPTGSPNSDCSRAAPCTLDRALQLSVPPGGQYIEVESGDYSETAPLHLTDLRHLVGHSASDTVVRNTAGGTVFVVDALADVTLDSLHIADAKDSMLNASDGYGASCPNTPSGPRTLHVLNSLFTNNMRSGIFGGLCTFEIRRSIFDGNYDGVSIAGNITIDRCSFISNPDQGALVDGNFSVTNSFFAQSQVGLAVGGGMTMAVLSFNTVVANGSYGVMCSYQPPASPLAAENNIIVGNAVDTAAYGTDPPCTYQGSIVGAPIAQLHFAHADAAPYDYHVMQGSIAIDAAMGPPIDHDYDGELRPKGNAADVGADEAF